MKRKLIGMILALAMVATFGLVPVGTALAAPIGSIFIGDLNVDSNLNQTAPYGGVPVYSPVLDSGKVYRFEVRGSYYANDFITADAKYNTRVYPGRPDLSWDWQDACGFYEATYPHVTELMVNGSFVDWGPFNSAHVYTFDFTGTGAAVAFNIYDLGQNNSGLLHVDIYLLPKLVGIDIKPGTDENSINLGSNGVVPVAILGSATFDASTVDPSTVTLEGAYARLKGNSGNYGSMQDANGDGYLDLVVQVTTQDLGLVEGATTATLTALTFSGLPIVGSDSVTIVPPQ